MGRLSTSSSLSPTPPPTVTTNSNNALGDIIKTTARFQETLQPMKQRPIIQVNPEQQQVDHLRNASIDSGRDNPFRPDGQIYKLADPIVDYYKHGANQSRAHSPTDSQLRLNIDPSNKSNKKNRKKRERSRSNKSASIGQDEPEKVSCWRKWFCYCCCCRCLRCDNDTGCCSSFCDRCKRCLTCGFCCKQSKTSPKQPIEDISDQFPKDTEPLKAITSQPSPEDETTHNLSICSEKRSPLEMAYSSRPAVDQKANNFKQTRVTLPVGITNSSSSNDTSRASVEATNAGFGTVIARGPPLSDEILAVSPVEQDADPARLTIISRQETCKTNAAESLEDNKCLTTPKSKPSRCIIS